MPVELFADRRALGIYGVTAGSQWTPGAQETPQPAQSVDTEGALLVATTIGTRTSPVIKFAIAEPLDPAATNWALNPQSVSGAGVGGFTQVKASGSSSSQLIRDLVGYDYAVLQGNPGLNSGEGVVCPVGVIPSPSGSVTAGVWLKGANGGEAVTLSLAAGTTVTSNVTLTTSWKWFTVTATSSVTPIFEVVGQGSVVLAFYATGWSIVPGASLANGFDGTFPGCQWTGAPHASQSTRPGPGGPRMAAIQADLEAAVKQLSLSGGTIRRSLPTSTGGTFRITYDVLNAQLSWDDTEWQVGGVAQGTLTCVCEPYGRGPEMTVTTDTFNPLVATNYIADAGALSNFTNVAPGLQAASNLTTENRFLYNGEYPMYSGEAQATFTPGATISGFKGGVILERGDSADYLEGYVSDNGTSSFLKVDKIVAGSRTNVLSATLGSRIVNGTAYTVRLRAQRQNQNDNVYAEYFAATSAPTATTAPTNTLGPYVITNAIFGALTPGLAGIVFTPQSSGAKVTTLIISPYLARERTLPVLRFGLAGVPGTAPGLGRMIVQDDSGHDQYWTRWGQQHDRLSRMATTTDFFYEAEALTAVNGASVVTGNAGASGGNVVRQTGLTTTLAAMLTTQLTGGGAQLAHIGDFEVWARVYVATANTGTADLALRWGTGDLQQFIVNSAVPEPTKGSYVITSLGTVHLPPTTAGTQQWQAQVLANSTVTGDTLDIDCVWLVPLNDGGATVAAVGSVPTVSVFTARDEFLQGSPTITGAALPIGGTWATSGSTHGDYSIDTTQHYVRRRGFTDAGSGFINGRFATASGSTLAGVAASIDLGIVAAITNPFSQGLVLRYVDTSNFAIVIVQGTGDIVKGASALIDIVTVVSGTSATVASGTIPAFAIGATAPPPFRTLQATIDAAGRANAYWGPLGGPYVFIASGSASALATGGTLASGLCGLYSWEAGVDLYFDNFWCEAFSGDAAFYSGRQLEVRSDRANRQNSGGTIWTPPSSYVGQYLRVPTPAFYDGVDNVLVKASRNDPATSNDPAIDAIEAQVNITPRYAQIPNL